jgi:transcriptional regulator with XRE-family HTH domain
MAPYSSELVKQARLDAGLTMTEFAYRLGKSTSTVARYESGQITPSLRVLTKMAEVLGVEVTDLYEPDNPRDEVAAFAAEMQRIIDKMPPFSEEQKTRLRALLRGVA